MKEIRLYVEGGGDSEATKRMLRAGFHIFFRELIGLARLKKIGFKIVLCGGRQNTCDVFQRTRKDHPDSETYLLIDSDCPVAGPPLKHIEQHHGIRLNDTDDSRCHFMAQIMESWYLADIDTLNHFFGKGFQPSAIPSVADVECVGKDAVLDSIKRAILQTNKPSYDKIRHAAEILKLLKPAEVRKASPHCERLFRTLEEILKS